MRQILSTRKPSVEKLLASIPLDRPERLDDVRRWSVAMMDAASRFQVAKRQNSLKNGGHFNG